MRNQIVNSSPWKATGLPDKKNATAQTPDRSCSMDSLDAGTPNLTELIRSYQNGDTKAALTLSKVFRPLIEKEAASLLKQNLAPSPEDAKSQAILHFLEFLSAFRRWDIDNKKVPGLAKKYLHDLRLDMGRRDRRHCPECYPIDFEKELEENSPYSQYFPCYEMETDGQLESRFRTLTLLESMEALTPKEKKVIKSFFADNKTPSQIAEEMHCSTRYLRSLKRQALKKMRLYLETYYPTLKAQ